MVRSILRLRAHRLRYVLESFYYRRVRPGMQSLVESTICFATDWLENYFEGRFGDAAQVLWFRAHNNRLYGWAISEV